MSPSLAHDTEMPPVPFVKDLVGQVYAAQKLNDGRQSHVILTDAASKESFTRENLVQDTIAFRDHLLERFSEQTKARLFSPHSDDEVFIFILLPSSYDFLVAFLSVTWLGAVAVLLGACFYIDLSHPFPIFIKN